MILNEIKPNQPYFVFAILQICKIVILVIAFFISTTLTAQDLHFSQFFNSPLSTNPANTGFIPDADYRLGIQYRNQFSNIMSAPYKTFSAFGDVQAFRNRFENGWLGLGGLLMNDLAGAGSLQSTKIYASVAGVVHKIDNWIGVKPLKQGYKPDVGDVVVGRIVAV